MEGTRMRAMADLRTFITDSEGKSGTLWCRGMAGTGKSSLMASLYGDLTSRAKIRCSSTVFIRYDRNIRADPSKIISTIARFLCDAVPFDVCCAISRAIETNPWVVKMSISSTKDQFSQLLQQPLRSIAGLARRGPLVVIIDGLDECGDVPEEILQVLAEGFGQDLHFVRLIIASRPLERILNAFTGRVTEQKLPVINLDASSKDVDAVGDIHKYVISRFCDIYNSMSDDGKFHTWCDDFGVVDRVAEQARGLFIWAVTVCNFIADSACESRVNAVLGNEKNSIHPLTNLYQTTLNVIVGENTGDSNKDLTEDIHAVLAVLVRAGRPKHLKILEKEIHLSRSDSKSGPPVLSILAKLFSVLQLTDQNMIQPIHQSFYDFLKDESQRGSKWYIGAKAGAEHGQ